MNRLVLLRHGRTEGTERHLYYGATDLPLLEDGVQDLQLAAARGVYPSPDGFTFVTSGMLRANQTLRAIYGDVPFSVIGDLSGLARGRLVSERAAEGRIIRRQQSAALARIG